MSARGEEFERVLDHDLSEVVGKFDSFVDSCRSGKRDFRLMPRAEPTAYARCFGIFNLWLTRREAELHKDRDELVNAIVDDLLILRNGSRTVPRDKGYRQLLAFSLSALAILKAEDNPDIGRLVSEQLPASMEEELRHLGCLEGKAQSGNQAMFLAIFHLHARTYLGIDTHAAINDWVRLHMASQNRFGFWGQDSGATHLHFQNGYHQYEILEYLNVPNPLEGKAIETVSGLADEHGHFAPYPGGGGCYDFDAVFVLTPNGGLPEESVRTLLSRTFDAVKSEQRNGGFAESLCVRPRRRNLQRFVRRVLGSPNRQVFTERAKYTITLQRPKHDLVTTHWTRTHREWGEANLWDSYFRMLLLARIQCAFDPERAGDWGFIDYPGIGWHPTLRKE